MLRFLSRFIGFWLLAAALVAAVVDGAKSLAASALSLTPLAETWEAMRVLVGVEGAAADSLPPPFPLDLALTWFLAIPTVLALAAVGILFLVVGAKRRRPLLGGEFAA